jgi:NADPH-dependent ferric siderophore reductase
LLVADATGSPAVVRILDEKTCERPFIARIEVPKLDDTLPDLCDVTWHTGFGGINGPTRLPQIVEAIQFPSVPNYIWVAGEAKATTGIHKLPCDKRGWPKDSVTAVG